MSFRNQKPRKINMHNIVNQAEILFVTVNVIVKLNMSIKNIFIVIHEKKMSQKTFEGSCYRPSVFLIFFLSCP